MNIIDWILAAIAVGITAFYAIVIIVLYVVDFYHKVCKIFKK